MVRVVSLSRAFLAGGLALAATAATAQQSQPTARLATQQQLQVRAVEVQPPQELTVVAPPRAVILRPGTTSDKLRALPVQRRLSATTLRANPVIKLQQGEANLAPVLNNERGLPRVATRLRAQPQLVNVLAEDLEVVELEQGLVVRQFLSYQAKPGTCTNPARKAQLERQGAQCFERENADQRTAAFSNPQDVRYIADPAQRSRAIAEARQAAAQEEAAIAADIAQLRAMLRNPAQRRQMVAEVGAAEVRRLSRMNDAQLEAEMVNSAEIEVEEVMFVPGVERANLLLKDRSNFVRLSPQQSTILARPDIVTIDPSRTFTTPLPPGPGTQLAAPAAAVPVTHEAAIADYVYLTGFTLGREHEWSRKVSVTIKWCVFGCKKTYYAEAYAGFGYGFGLRFPIRVAGLYNYERLGNTEKATLTPIFLPINGSVSDYQSAGLSNSQMFDGQEFVAEIGAYAGLNYKVPFKGSGNIHWSVDLDATDKLPQPYRNGQFKPPAPGENTPPVTRTFTEIDLLGGRANFYFVGAKVHPALKFSLTSNGLRFKLNDLAAGNSLTMNQTGKPYPLAVDNNHRSRFTISDPVYNLAFEMTPGLVGRVFVDVSVWSHHWDWPVWFPQLTVQLPPGGANFGCHYGTTCARGHNMIPPADVLPPPPPPRAPLKPTLPRRSRVIERADD